METYQKLNDAWKKTCTILFGKEIGDLKEYEPYILNHLNQHNGDLLTQTNQITLFHPLLNKNTLVNSKQLKEWKASLDAIKDIDSLIEEMKGVVQYNAPTTFGTCHDVHQSDLITDCSVVQHSYMLTRSKYCYGCCWLRDQSTHAFGCGPAGTKVQFSLMCELGASLKAGFETYAFISCSNIYYSHFVKNAHNIMFSFFQIGKQYVIGNVQLTRGEYIKIRDQLIEQMVDELEKHKALPSLFELVNNSQSTPPSVKMCDEEEVDFLLDPIENGFKKTCSILFKRSNITLDTAKTKTPLYTHRAKQLLPVAQTNMFGQKVEKFNLIFMQDVPILRIIPLSSTTKASTLSLDKTQITSFDSLKKHLGKIALVCVGIDAGKCWNVKHVSSPAESYNIYYAFGAAQAHDQAYVLFGCPGSTHTYFSSVVFYSSFVINSFCSVDIKRAFEVDRCFHCSDLYYCHDCQGCQHMLFSFHHTGKRYVVGNRPLAQTEYLKIKNHLISQLWDKWVQKPKTLPSILDMFQHHI